jgi:hypothetical protein
MYTKNFITFGDNKYKKALNRINLEAINSKFFDGITIYSENDLPIQMNNYCLNNPRGYGFWSWKPYLILKRLREINDDDILIYADAGCTIDQSCKKRYDEYIKYLENNDIVCFQLDHLIKSFTKMSLINYLDCYHLLNVKQIMATIIILKKTQNVMEMIEKWYNLSQIPYHIDDSRSIIPNDETFIDNRHDQSIFSLLCYIYGEKCKILMIHDETYRKEPGFILCPFKATRLRF